MSSDRRHKSNDSTVEESGSKRRVSSDDDDDDDDDREGLVDNDKTEVSSLKATKKKNSEDSKSMETAKSASKTKKKTKKRKKQLQAPTNNTATKKNPSDPIDQDDDGDGDQSNGEDEDNELLAAAAAWAGKKEDGSPKNLSLHITQLPFDTNELDLRRLFAEQGCAVSSIRLVYDRDEHGRKTVFRGVAFVDLSTSDSYEKALALNRKSSIRGRKLNIRPTRSKQELANIVSQTQSLVQEKIKQQREEKDKTKGEVGDLKNHKATTQREKRKQKKLAKKEKAKVAKAQQPKAKHPKSTEKKENEPERKMTKKERNRRAAIIVGLKGRKY